MFEVLSPRCVSSSPTTRSSRPLCAVAAAVRLSNIAWASGDGRSAPPAGWGEPGRLGPIQPGQGPTSRTTAPAYVSDPPRHDEIRPKPAGTCVEARGGARLPMHTDLKHRGMMGTHKEPRHEGGQRFVHPMARGLDSGEPWSSLSHVYIAGASGTPGSPRARYKWRLLQPRKLQVPASVRSSACRTHLHAGTALELVVYTRDHRSETTSSCTSCAARLGRDRAKNCRRRRLEVPQPRRRVQAAAVCGPYICCGP